jgi:UDP-galactopyranose mutase
MAGEIIVFSHLRWDFVYQRPQQILSRFAHNHRVYFIEEPVYAPGPAGFEQTEPVANVHVCRPHTPVGPAGFHDDQIPAVRELVERLVEREQLSDYVVWFYSPMALPLIQGLSPAAIVYDCMDELSAFLNAPKQLMQRERALFKIADIVFAGGPSLYRTKSREHHAVYCFPSSVDVGHFGRARDPEIEHGEQRSICGPKLGFYGVIDERLDLQIISRLASAHRRWQIMMVGPVVKIDPMNLPRAANIHYFGQRSYDELPQFLAGWDVCLLPFALNQATQFISPTKTLEYMAAHKPIVSTPITDVAQSCGHVLRVAEGADSFIRACEESLAESALERQRRVAAMDETVANTSWDTTATGMRNLIVEAIHRPSPPRADHVEKPHPPAARQIDAATVVIGAGPTGLSAAYHLGAGSVLLEQGATVGGWCRSYSDQGFTFDHAGHIMFSTDPYVHELYRLLLGDNVHWQDREAWVYTDGVYTRYPFQSALHGLPPDVLKECLVGAIEARFGSIKEAQTAGGGVSCSDKPDALNDCCADGVAEINPKSGTAIVRPIRSANAAPQNFEAFIYKVWGAGVAKHFAIPYNRKLWALPLTEMETSWLGGRVPLPDLEEMIDGATRPVAKPVGPNARFGYPLRGGFQALMNGFLPLLEGELKLNARVARVSPTRHEVNLADGTCYRYQQLISTVPLPHLIAMIGPEAPSEVHIAARALRHVSVRCVNLGIARPSISDKHWIYYAGNTVFHRVFVQGNASPHCNPEGGFALTCEITYAPTKPLPCEGESLIELCIADCVRTGMLRADDKIIVRSQVDMPYAYVVYDHARKRNVELIQTWLEKRDIILAGRYAQWQYYNSDHAFIAGKEAAERAQCRQVEECASLHSIIA